MDNVTFLTAEVCCASDNYEIFGFDNAIWREAFEYIVGNLNEQIFDKEKMHLFWTVNGGHIRNKIRDDCLLLQFLKLVLPGYNGCELTLFRGECRFLYEEGKIGFCWTPKIEVARRFALGRNAIESGGVLLQAYAPLSAILAAPNSHSGDQMRESEYTCNPNLLERIEVLNFFQKTN